MKEFLKKQALPQVLHFALGASCASGVLIGSTIAIVVAIAVSWIIAIGVQVVGRVLKNKPIIDPDSRAYAVVIVVSSLIVTFQIVVISTAVSVPAVVMGLLLATLLALAREGLQLPAQRVDDLLLDIACTSLGGVVIGAVRMLLDAR